jgi:replicative DNA helicase
MGRPIVGLPTTIAPLDRALGGLNRGLYVLGGAPAVGKTSLGVQIATAAASSVPVVYVTFENPPDNLVLKAVCRIAGVSTSAVERGKGDLARLSEAAREFANPAQRWSFIEGTHRVTLGTVRDAARDALARHEAARCLIVIDYLQRMAIHHAGDVADRLAPLTLGLSEIAAEMNSPVLALSSLVRTGSYDAPTLGDLASAGDLEFSADVVLLLGARQDVSLSSKAVAKANAGTRLLDLLVAKNRYGEAGQRIPLLFRPAIGAFHEDAQG